MENRQISVMEALNQIQSWLNAGEFDKVIQGAGEILELEPGNQRALSLLKQAEEERHKTLSPTPPINLTSPLNPSPPNPDRPFDPLERLQVENKPEMIPEEDGREKRKLFLAMLLPALVVVIGGGAAIWGLANQEREEVIEDQLSSSSGGEEDLTYLEENEQRITELTEMATLLESYKVENGAYPSVDQVEAVLAKNKKFVDPRQGEIDKAGKPFGYVYAVYKGFGDVYSAYVLSSLFEDSKGFAYAWTKGAPIKNYPDYRDTEQSNVVFIGD